MGSSEQKQRPHRPPPIRVPGSNQARQVVPGPNAFAIAARAKQEKSSEVNHSTATPATTPLEESHFPQSESQGRKNGSSRGGSAMTTFTSIMEAARGSSPRKSDGHSSVVSRQGSTTRSRHSNRSQKSGTSSQPAHSKIAEEDETTTRGHIESQAEKKFFKMMGQLPGTPPADANNFQAHVVQAGHYTEKVPRPAEKKPEDGSKSPKKKIFGMSIPTFRSSASSTPGPPMPPKAAQLLGPPEGTPIKAASPTIMPRDAPRSPKQPQAVRSDTSKSLPSKLHRQQSHSRRPNHPDDARPHTQTPNRKAQASEKVVQWQDGQTQGQVMGCLEDGVIPPTPPEKDTPRESKPTWAQSKLAFEATPNEQLRIPTGIDGLLPDFLTSAKTIPSNGGDSPTKFRPYGAEDYVELIEPERVRSAHGMIDIATPVGELPGDDHHYPANNEMQRNYPTWWDETRQKEFAALAPRFYSPSNYRADPQRLLFAVPSKPKPVSSRSASIEVAFQGQASEIDADSSTKRMIEAAVQQAAATTTTTTPAPTLAVSPAKPNSGDSRLAMHVRMGLRGEDSSEPHEPPGPAGTNPHNLHADQSSSRLTDMLNGVSPSKAGYNDDFYASYPSALPSPLNNMVGPHMPPFASGVFPPFPSGTDPTSPPESSLGLLPDGSNILTHFYMCNQHIDTTGRILFDEVVKARKATIKAGDDKQDTTISILEERFNDIKVLINSVGEKVDHVSERNQTVNSKMDRLLDFIKADVVAPLATQIKKNAEMESNIKALQSTVHDLQKSVETRSSISSPPSMYPAGLPQNRSQPSLAGFYDFTSDTTRDNQNRMASTQESRSDGRSRNGINNNHGGHWGGYRFPAAGRDNKEENYAFPSGNPFHPLNGGQFNSNGTSYANGYNGYYPNVPNDHSFNYNSGASK